MNKNTCIISSPLDTYSGYGARSRDLIRSIIKVKGEDWDIKLLSQRWGNCPFGFLQPGENDDMLSRIIQPQDIKTQPDVFIMISVPNEMQRVGKWNILITAGVESDIVPGDCLFGANQADLIIVSSEHSKEGFVKAKYDQIDNQTKQKVAELTCVKEISVLFEGIDTNVFQKIDWVE